MVRGSRAGTQSGAIAERRWSAEERRGDSRRRKHKQKAEDEVEFEKEKGSKETARPRTADIVLAKSVAHKSVSLP